MTSTSSYPVPHPAPTPVIDLHGFVVTVDFGAASVSVPTELPRPVRAEPNPYRRCSEDMLTPYSFCRVTGASADAARERGLAALQEAILDGTVTKVRRMRLQ